MIKKRTFHTVQVIAVYITDSVVTLVVKTSILHERTRLIVWHSHLHIPR